MPVHGEPKCICHARLRQMVDSAGHCGSLMRMKPYLSLLAVTVLAAGVLLFGAAAPDKPESATTSPTMLPTLDPQKLLAGPDVSEEAESVRGELQAVVKAAQGPLTAATAHAALANWYLSAPTGRPATRWIMGVATTEDLEALAKAAKSAQEQLTEAAAQLKKADEADDANSTRGRRRRLKANIASLKAFAGAMAAASLDVSKTATRDTWADVAGELAESRESDQLELASAATLWQAMAWELAGRRERALTTLPGAIAKVERPCDFLARILRCRILAESGQPTAALALAAQIRFSIDDWYKEERLRERRLRKRLVALLELKVGRDWAKDLRSSTQPADAEILVGILQKTQKSLFPTEDTSPDIYILPAAVPVVVEPPQVGATSTAPADSPSTKPSEPPAEADEAGPEGER